MNNYIKRVFDNLFFDKQTAKLHDDKGVLDGL